MSGGSGSRTTTAVALAGNGAFQACLAAGAPWGRFAYGGGHDGRLPDRLRRVSAGAAVGYGVAAALVQSGAGRPAARRGALSALTAVMGLGVVANGASRSPHERLLWTPVCALTAASAWLARPALPGAIGA